jgi:hypothetical protein
MGAETSKAGGLRWKLLVALTSAVVTAVIALGGAELYLRATGSRTSPEALREASLEYEPTLFARHAFPRLAQRKRPSVGAVEISARGYRGPAFAIPKPPGVVRLVVLGGSAAFDLHAFEGRDWPRLVETRLRANGFPQVEVINAGTPGHATWDALGRLYSEIWMLEPDYVLVYEAWNDIKYFRWLTPERDLLRTYRPATPGPTREGLVANPFLYYSGPLDRALGRSQLYTALRARYLAWRSGVQGQEGWFRDGDPGAAGSAERADRYGPWGPRQYELTLHLIADAAQQIGARPVFVTQARLVAATNRDGERRRIPYEYVGLTHDALVRAFADCDRALMAAARAKTVPVLDLAALHGRDELFTDHVHTNPQGSEAVASAVAAFLSQMLATAGARSGGA